MKSIVAGQVLVTSTQGARPLLLYDTTLLAQAEPHEQSDSLRLVGLDTKDLGVIFELDVPLPAGVHPSIDDRLGSSFHAGARLDAGGIVVQWRSVERRITGARPTSPLVLPPDG